MKKHWDIFCKIVDNFGDIGVCWRLAKQLHNEYNIYVRLLIDHPQAAKKIIFGLNLDLHQQTIDGICIQNWNNETDFSQAADVVIEAFSCELPSVYLTAMAQKKSQWVNLEYLSAEAWVEDFHAKPSPQANGLTRYFYFPGFTETTGGLIRERGVFHLNQIFANNKNSQDIFWESLNLSNEDHLKVSLFCYPHAPIASLLSAMAESNQSIECYVPEGSILPQIADFFGQTLLIAGEKCRHKNLSLHILPFLNQADYDRLLTACDINFVRGEDSWLRATWAGKPFIWQPYFQDENTHIIKLEAFLTLFYGDLNIETPKQLHHAWVGSGFSSAIWQDYLDQLPLIADHTLRQSQLLAQQSDLAAKLVIFCNKN